MSRKNNYSDIKPCMDILFRKWHHDNPEKLYYNGNTLFPDKLTGLQIFVRDLQPYQCFIVEDCLERYIKMYDEIAQSICKNLIVNGTVDSFDAQGIENLERLWKPEVVAKNITSFYKGKRLQQLDADPEAIDKEVADMKLDDPGKYFIGHSIGHAIVDYYKQILTSELDVFMWKDKLDLDGCAVYIRYSMGYYETKIF